LKLINNLVCKMTVTKNKLYFLFNRRHHCPHLPTGFYDKSGEPCLLTEYHEKYPLYGNVKPRNSFKPVNQTQGNRGRMEGTSTFRSDYVPHDVARRPGRVQKEYRPQSGQMDHSTTYKMDYNPHKVKPAAMIRPAERKPGKGTKVDTIPTYKDDYRMWEIPKKPPKADQAYCPPTTKFGNPSTFQDDFGPKGLVATESCKPPNIPKVSDVPFEGLTSHRVAYVPHQLENRFIRQKEEYKPSDQPFEDLTTHRRDYRGLHGDLAKSCKPESTKIGSDAPFETSSEFRDRYQPWPVSLPYVHKKPKYVQPDGHMDMKTTSQLDYVGHKIKPPAPFRPASARKVHAPFQGNTTMKEDFRPWDTPKLSLIKKDDEIKRPSGKFDDLTTFKSHYIPHQLNPSQSCKPSNQPLHSTTPFDDGTMYRIDYTPKKLEICPASYPTPPGYIFEHTDTRGHKLYQKLPALESDNMQPAFEMHVSKI
uniref:Stabilizer of axonemal microtubules 2 n=1 Tax=Callorhinchus milii TaxID=7868 RepID=A0A4W3HB52_CALMI